MHAFCHFKNDEVAVLASARPRRFFNLVKVLESKSPTITLLTHNQSRRFITSHQVRFIDRISRNALENRC